MKNAIFGLILISLAVGCGGDKKSAKSVETKQPDQVESSNKSFPSFILVWSESTSWPALNTDNLEGLINPKSGGEHGSLEIEHGVDIVLRRRDYIQSGVDFSSNTCDAVCYTNVDALNLANNRPCTVIRASNEACIDGIASIDDFESNVIYGPENCVSEYLVQRARDLGKLESDVDFVHMEADAASMAIQSSNKTSKVQSTSLRQPFLSQAKAELKFDNTIVPNEIVDCIVWSNDSLEKEGGKQAALCINCLFDRLSKTSQIHALFDDPDWQKLMSTTVVDTAVKVGIIKKPIDVGYNDSTKSLNFSTEYQVFDTGEVEE